MPYGFELGLKRKFGNLVYALNGVYELKSQAKAHQARILKGGIATARIKTELKVRSARGVIITVYLVYARTKTSGEK